MRQDPLAPKLAPNGSEEWVRDLRSLQTHLAQTFVPAFSELQKQLVPLLEYFASVAKELRLIENTLSSKASNQRLKRVLEQRWKSILKVPLGLWKLIRRWANEILRELAHLERIVRLVRVILLVVGKTPPAPQRLGLEEHPPPKTQEVFLQKTIMPTAPNAL